MGLSPIRCSQRARATSARVGCSLDQLRESARSQSWTRPSLALQAPHEAAPIIAPTVQIVHPVYRVSQALCPRLCSWSVKEGAANRTVRHWSFCSLHLPTQPMMCCFQKPVRVGFQRPLPKASASLGLCLCAPSYVWASLFTEDKLG